MIYLLKSDTKMPNADSALLDSVSIIQLLGIRVLGFEVESIDIQSYDYILLTSKNAIQAISNHECAPHLLQKQAIVIGNRTKDSWLQVGGSVLFCPPTACNGTMLAQLISDYVRGKKILYICGKDRATDLCATLNPICTITPLVVYESYENPNITTHRFADESIFIFGSPKHYKIFLKHYTWNPTWFAISLGDTTYASFADNIRKLNAKGDFIKALKVAQAMRNDTPMQDNTTPQYIAGAVPNKDETQENS